MFKIGDQVVWVSGASGVQKEKRGKIEVVIPPHKRLTRAQQEEADAYGAPRDHESYLVRVPGKTAKAKGKLYWPRTSTLTIVA